MRRVLFLSWRTLKRKMNYRPTDYLDNKFNIDTVITTQIYDKIHSVKMCENRPNNVQKPKTAIFDQIHIFFGKRILWLYICAVKFMFDNN
ncbi:MAG: hypothetical protein LBQ22_09210 [Bacteroidales bacterium]|nr:hypothetical protein [Bacteroidales bacterium]